jgi:hypothetical protein
MRTEDKQVQIRVSNCSILHKFNLIILYFYIYQFKQFFKF